MNRVRRYLRKYKPELISQYLKNRKLRDLTFSMKDWQRRDLYDYYKYAFEFRAPAWLQTHRDYFVSHSRGFGESAFHSTWLEVLGHFRPRNCLEIGVYRGQVISLWQLISQKLEFEIEVAGITPLCNLGDQFSQYIDIDYEADIETNFKEFRLPLPRLVNGMSTSPLAIEFMESRKWDLIYIDGGHDFDVVFTDYQNAKKNLRHGGILCLDDSSLYLNIEIQGAFKGHPGPSKVTAEFAQKELTHFMTVGHNNFFINS
jgi:hypothetical protein